MISLHIFFHLLNFLHYSPLNLTHVHVVFLLQMNKSETNSLSLYEDEYEYECEQILKL